MAVETTSVEAVPAVEVNGVGAPPGVAVKVPPAVLVWIRNRLALVGSIMAVKPVTVPFNGTGPSMNALVGGQVDYMCDQIVNVVPQINGGTIKGYAVGTVERNPALPDLPTAKEAGLPAFEAQAWNALFAPKDTPKPVLDKLNAAVVKALDEGHQVGTGEVGRGST